MWKVAPKSKTQLVRCEVSPNYILGMFTLEDIRAIDACIFCYSIWSVLIYDVLSIFANIYKHILGLSMFPWNFLSEVPGFGQLGMKWYSDPNLNHVFGFRPLCSLRLLLEFCELKGDFLYPFYFFCCLHHFLVECEPPQGMHLDCAKFEFSNPNN